MLSDGELRAELVRLGVNPGPITASTRSTYQKKLNKLLDAAKTPSNGYGQSDQSEAPPSNGHKPVHSPTNSQLREQLRRLGHNAGPITETTRGLYLNKLAKLQAATNTNVNGYDRPSTADGVGVRQRRLHRDSESEPEPELEPEEMDVSDPMGEWDSVAPSWEDSMATSYSASESELDVMDCRRDSPSTSHRPAGRSPMFDGGPPMPPSAADQDLSRLGRSSLYRADPAPSPSIRSWLPRDDPSPAVQGRHRPEPPSRTRHYPETLFPRGTGGRTVSSLLPERRPTPPPPAGRAASYQMDGGRLTANWFTDPSPVARVEPPPAERPGSLRKLVSAWCQPSVPAAPSPPSSPPPAADYDTCSDSESEEAASPTLTPSQQLQAFRRRMATGGGGSATLADRNQVGFRAAPAPAHGTSHLVPYCILLLAVLFFGVLGLSYLRLARTDEAGGATQLEAAEDASSAVAVFPICGDPMTDGRGCVPPERLEPAVQLLSAVQPALLAAARDALCGRRELPAVPLTELAESTGSPQDRLRDLAILVAYNSQLGLLTEPAADGGDTTLSATDVSTPWLCLAGDALTFVFKWGFTLVTVYAGLLVVRGVVMWRRRSRQQQEQQLYQMVESIMEVVRRHTLTATSSDKPYVAVDHVRDELLTPEERSRRDQVALWQRAVQFIREKESRVREECVMVAGESHTVWRWLPGTAAAAASGASGGRDRRRVWLGQAFQTSSGVNTPGHTRTNCLKIRHMFDPTCETSDSGWQQDVRDALLEKCDGVAVMHIAVDDRSTEGLVYVKCRTDADALNAFKRIQGCWFDGRLVSVKFIRLERYHQRYPDAAAVTEPMRPSNGLRRSLADLPTPAPTEDD